MAVTPTKIDPPGLEDGAAMWRMARSTGLDRNSPYKYLVFCRDFPGTSAVARVGGREAGFVTGYARPGTSCLFIWQIAVEAAFRQRGVARAMLEDILGRPGAAFTSLEATINPTNAGSRRLFAGLADARGATLTEEVLFPAGLFPEPHEDEILLHLGSLAVPRRVGASARATHHPTEQHRRKRGA